VAQGQKSPQKIRTPRGGKEVSAMGWIEDTHGAVLLVKQKRGRKLWTLPGGKINATEGVEAGLAREIREETGARVTFATQMALFDRPEKRNITFLYRAQLQPGDALKPKPREIAAVEYRAELPPEVSPSLQYFWKMMRQGCAGIGH
jgi:ADP-ribose pyrophosphatase YjhB (NUDIX family)